MDVLTYVTAAIAATDRRMPDLSLERQKAAKGGFPRRYPAAHQHRGRARLRVRHNPQDDMAMRVGSRRKHRGKLILA
jgi:hypothetical protein